MRSYCFVCRVDWRRHLISLSRAASLLSLPRILTRPHCSAMSSLRFLRDAEKLLLAVWGGRRLCHHEGQNDKPVKRLRLCQIQRPQLCPDSTGDKAAQSGWKKCKCVRIKGAVSLINLGICSLFVWAVSKPSSFISSFKRLAVFSVYRQFFLHQSFCICGFLPDWYLSTWQDLPVWSQIRRRGCFTWIFMKELKRNVVVCLIALNSLGHVLR